MDHILRAVRLCGGKIIDEHGMSWTVVLSSEAMAVIGEEIEANVLSLAKNRVIAANMTKEARQEVKEILDEMITKRRA